MALIYDEVSHPVWVKYLIMLFDLSTIKQLIGIITINE